MSRYQASARAVNGANFRSYCQNPSYIAITLRQCPLEHCVASEGPAGVEDAGRVKRRFDRLVHGQRRGSELLPQPGLLEHPDAMLTRDRPAQPARVIAEP